MNSKTVRRANAARNLGISLVVIGLVAIALLVTATVKPIGPALPSFDTWAPLHRLPWMPNPIVLVSALVGFAILWLGATIISRQKAVFEADRRETEDRLRRVREYGGDGRIEPYIGSPITIDIDKEPQ
jgi:hypothetical protein